MTVLIDVRLSNRFILNVTFLVRVPLLVALNDQNICHDDWRV